MPVLANTIADRNLLFGILALQMDFIQREALIAAMHAWVLDKTQTLGEILVRQGSLSASRRQLLDALVEEHVDEHGDDVRQSLISLAPTATLPHELRGLDDPDLMASLGDISAESSLRDPLLTLAAPPSATGTRFRIVRPHAKGGLGQVSIAIDEELHREVALKEIRPLYADHEESRARFVMEAEITGNLEHPGIVPIYGLGSYADGRPYYAMRFIRGETLEEAIARFHKPDEHSRCSEARTIRFRKLLKCFVDACNAIAYAHSRQVLHRDLKPANIMLCRYGETLVVDWGLAKVLDRDASQIARSTDPAAREGIRPRRREENQGGELPLRPLAASGSAPTQFGVAVGTPQFMSPEQAAGQVDQLSPVSDVYSLGATLYCLLTGRPPLAGDDLGETLRRVQCGDFPAPREANQQVSPALEAICLRAMALSPPERYASATELADDVERWLADEPVMARIETWYERMRRWSRKHRSWTEAAAMALVAVAAVAVIAAVVVARAWSHEAEARNETAELLVLERLERENALRMTERAEQLRLEAEEAHRETEAARRALEKTQTELARQITHLGLEEQLRRSVQSKPLLWEIAADRIEPLSSKSRHPSGHDQSMQTSSAFRQARAQRTISITSLQLLPLGDFSEMELSRLEIVRDYLARFYDLPTTTLKPLDRQAWRAAGIDRKPAAAALPVAEVLERLVTPRQSGSTALLAVTTLELCDDQSLPLFSSNTADHPAGVVSLASFISEPVGAGSEAPRWLRRTLKLSAGAAGAVLGMQDFAAYDCGMNSARTLAALDAKPLLFCPECEQKVWLLGDVEPLERYRSLIEFALRHGLDAEAAFWERAMLAIRGESAGSEAVR